MRNWKKHLAVCSVTTMLLMGLMAAPICANAETAASAEEMEVTVLPELSLDTLAEVNAEQMAKYCTEDNVAPMLWQGLLEQKITVGEKTRTVKLYVPEGTRQGTMFVVMNVPEGEETLTFMKESGWMDKADEEGFCLWVLEPGENGWGTAEEEAAYVKAAISAEGQGTYCMAGPSMYFVGYGEIGTEIHKYVMGSPLQTAAAIFFDASDIDAETLAAYEEKSFNTSTKTYDVDYKDVPVPVLIASEEISEETDAVIDYWDHASENIADFSYEDIDVSPIVETISYDYTSPETTDSAWSFLGEYYRYGSGVCSNFISYKFDYTTKNVTFEHFTDSNGINREYLVYIPDGYEDSAEELPVVFVYHGASNSAVNAFENSLWYLKADEEGFIVVAPQSTLVVLPPSLGGRVPKMYRPLWQVEDESMRETDLVYTDEMLDDLISKYNVDEDRFYLTGHSMGSMMTNYIGSSYVGERFAALGATSGPAMALDETLTSYVPMWQTFGEYDMWSSSLEEDGAEMLLNAVNYWLVHNALATEANVADVRLNGGTTYEEGRFTHTDWSDETGMVIYRYTVVSKKDHVNLPSENFMLWDDWFSKWEKTEDGNRAYEGTAIKLLKDPTITCASAASQMAYASGKTFNLNAVTSGEGKLTYKSSDTKVATVSSKGKVTIKGTGKVTITITSAKTAKYAKATKKVTFKVVPAKAAISKVVSSKKGQLTVTVKKDSKATGYQIQVSTSKKFTKSTTATLTKTSKTFTKLTAGKKYYVRVRAYKTISSKKCYGAYSAVKSVTVKK